jgi:DNA-binding NtrC family response regulator
MPMESDLPSEPDSNAPPGTRQPIDLKARLLAYERLLIEQALRQHEGNQRRAARSLGVLPTTLHEKMKRLGMRRRGSATQEPAA